MDNIDKFIITDDKPVFEALQKLDKLSNDVLVLFVIDINSRMVGTLTDGDIRRALIKGMQLQDPISRIMHTDFAYISINEPSVTEKIKAFKDRKIALVPLLDGENKIQSIYNLQKLKSILPIDAVLMAGGKGERLRPLTDKMPKPLLPVGGKAIIDHNIDRLISYGIKNISVTVNYLKEQIEEHYSKPRNGILINCCREPSFLGTMGAVKLVNCLHNDVVLIMNSDLFTNINYEDFYLHFIESDADMSVAAIPYSISIPYGICDLDGHDVKGVVEKPTYNYYANAGIYLLKRNLLELIPDETFFNATDMIDLLVKMNKKVIRFPLNGTWIDIGTPQEYQKANDLIKHMSF